jgi:hypothetical protein
LTVEANNVNFINEGRRKKEEGKSFLAYCAGLQAKKKF